MILAILVIVIFSYVAFESLNRSMQRFRFMLDKSPLAATAMVTALCFGMPITIVLLNYLMHLIVTISPAMNTIALLAYTMASLVGTVRGLMDKKKS